MLGAELVHAIVNQDPSALTAVLAGTVDFRAITPSRSWEAATGEAVCDIVLGTWFPPERRIERLVALHVDESLPVPSLRYRFHVSRPDGHFVVEQHALYTCTDALVSSLHISCTGFLPTSHEDESRHGRIGA
jgi:hypothetical protein